MKVKGPFIFMLLVACTQLLHAQPKKDSITALPGLKSLFKVRLSSDLGFEWEKRISPVSSISLFGGLSFGRQSNNFADTKAKIIDPPALFAEYKNYYNLRKRIEKHKPTKLNSAAFLFGRIETIFKMPDQNSFSLLFAEGWGAQSFISRKIQVGIHLGAIEHFYYDKPGTGGFNYIKLEPMVNFSVGLVF